VRIRAHHRRTRVLGTEDSRVLSQLTDAMMGYLVLAGTVFGVNLLPAFGPPTWAVLVFFRLQSSLAAVPLVLIGALAAASGRLALAFASRRFRDRLPTERLENLAAARDVIAGGPKRAAAGLGAFALSPLPSAQLFVAAGLLAAPLVPLTAAFFAGRLVSYTIYVTAASAAKHSLGSIIKTSFTSPLGIAVQLAMLAGLLALLRVDWARILTGRATRRASKSHADRVPTTARHPDRQDRPAKLTQPPTSPADSIPKPQEQ
jgi:uncharacterized integral membrane protein